MSTAFRQLRGTPAFRRLVRILSSWGEEKPQRMSMGSDTGAAGAEDGSKYFMIEQDRCYGRTPYESLAISRDNLVKMGYGDWF